MKMWKDIGKVMQNKGSYQHRYRNLGLDITCHISHITYASNLQYHISHISHHICFKYTISHIIFVKAHMGQFLQDAKNGCFVSYVFKKYSDQT